ncbi:uncharacterized protein PHACADRAFT_174996 [Phanerochaete carnosa HHB-10118-sp]|uniref:Uncharacterized protein n=1 Tax=Phanerochaete carnosa (strain HHB-10118-sp) TaxID=650164 RepID=K5VSL8_PHACS|nr:uncharacterized protein PHACADRAFT_174996 [Phanerochaete carnosa HHB-10118-sp]EKM54488.1 hypothetical protein PHACADRAFT_174996 [Phanerochaete carnosa HHB-10118-sp]
MMALPSENPILAANLQFVLSRVSGFDMPVDSLRNALLGIAAVHTSFLAAREGDAKTADDSVRLANAYRSQSVCLLNKACLTTEGVQSDSTIAATAAIALLDILSSGHSWAANLDLVRTVVNARGGPAVILARSARPQIGTISGVSRARLFLETVAMYELFGCIGTGQRPTVLQPDADGWWLQAANNGDDQSHVDECFGISRSLVPLLSRVVSVVCDVLEKYSDEAPCKHDGMHLMYNARVLYDALDSWSEPGTVHERITAGNCIYRSAAQILILRDVFGLTPADVAVQRLANVVLSLAADCGAQRLSVGLNWPMIIAGSQVVGADRARVLDIFEYFRCLETSAYVVSQVRKRMDISLPGADWRSVMKDESIDVLIV